MFFRALLSRGRDRKQRLGEGACRKYVSLASSPRLARQPPSYELLGPSVRVNCFDTALFTYPEADWQPSASQSCRPGPCRRCPRRRPRPPSLNRYRDPCTPVGRPTLGLGPPLRRWGSSRAGRSGRFGELGGTASPRRQRPPHLALPSGSKRSSQD